MRISALTISEDKIKNHIYTLKPALLAGFFYIYFMILRMPQIYFIFFFLAIALNAQKKDSIKSVIETDLSKIDSYKKKINYLIKRGESVLEDDLYVSEKYLDYAQSFVKADDKKRKARILKSLGNVYHKKGENNKSLLSYLQSRNLYEELNDTLNIAKNLLKEGVVYNYLKEYQKAINSSKESIRLANLSNNLSLVGRNYISMGGTYRRLEKIDSSFIFYNNALKIFTDIKDELRISTIKNDLALLHGSVNRYDEAVKIHLGNIGYIKENHSQMNISTTFYNIGYSFLKLKEYDKSLKYLDSSLQVANKQGFKYIIAKITEKQSIIHKELGNFEEAFNNHVLFKKYSDSIFSLKKQKQIKELELKNEFEAERKELEAIASRKELQKRLYLRLFIIVLIAALIIGYLIWRDSLSRTQIVKDKYEKEKLKKQVLVEQVKASETELKYLIADNTMRLEFIKQLSNQIRKDKRSNDYKTVQEYANTLLLKLQQQITTENKLSLVQDKINEVNKGFEEKLKTLYPNLTKTEREMCSFLRLNLSIKEIASIRNSSIDSIKALRYRIRKKMQIPKNEELEGFVQGI